MNCAQGENPLGRKQYGRRDEMVQPCEQCIARISDEPDKRNGQQWRLEVPWCKNRNRNAKIVNIF